ncbi:non-homologous end-joining DNA ligase [Yinghuangia sp. ASG 101]|uniref:non-homologous end-joining DNA ligase n=1 Tax=Yinghuangia sp. ASG 101 TaxID=2896848 RepID=UPI001E29A306|nr:non-homologous end-joining DNA ligase [Yinghuangia sp. ASG 101]UGQ12948.1 non-homologous end-joining DNA ligase [Yinghuangia sp. ASG 101]
MSSAEQIEIDGRSVRVTNVDKVYFPERGFTKGDVVRYVLSVGEGMLRAFGNRPTTLERYPDGVGGESFYQKRVPKYRPEWIRTARIRFPSGRTADELCPDGTASLVWAANLGCLTFHPWPVRRGDTEHPDELRIDLDPQPGTGFADAVRAAHEMRAVLGEYGLTAWPKTSGGRGLHLFVPIRPAWPFVDVRRAVIALGRELESRMPDQVTTAWWKEERGRRVFVDYNQMARDRTIAAAYSPRANQRATVSAPLTWDEVDDARPDDFDLATMPERFARLGDVHADMSEHAFSLDSALALSDRQARDSGSGDLPYPPDHPKMPGEPPRVQPSRARNS